MPFHARLALYTFLLSTVLASLLLFIQHREHLLMRAMSVQQGQSLVTTSLEDSARTALLTGSYAVLAGKLNRTTEDNYVDNLAVLDQTGLVVAATETGLLGQIRPPQLFVESNLRSATPIESASGPVGSFIVILSNEPFVTRFRQAHFYLYLAAGISLLVMTLLAWFLGRAVTLKLNQLSDAIASLARGNWNIHLGNHDSSNEVGRLSNSFNEMVATLGRTRRQRQTAVMRLRANNEQLADLVEDQKRTNAELKVEIALRQRTESREKKVLEASPDATMIVRRDGTIDYVNRQVERLFTTDRQALLGTDLKALVPWNEILGIIELKQETLMLPPKMSTGPRSVFYATGEGNRRIPVEISARALSEGEQPAYIVVVRDISVQKKLESQTRQLQRDLIHMGRIASLSELATGLAHELNQPLTAITHNADAAVLTIEGANSSDKQTEEELLGYVREIESQALRAGGIIRTLRGFVRKQPSRLQELDLPDTILRTLRLVERDAQDKDIDLWFDSWDAPEVLADPIEIAQVLLNLLTNAIDSIANGDCDERWIAINMSVTGDFLKIGVEDSGAGLHNAERAFVPFETTKKGGIGMGLHLCRNLVLAHGGDLWFETAKGGGALFLFTLPLVANTDPKKIPSKARDAIPI